MPDSPTKAQNKAKASATNSPETRQTGDSSGKRSELVQTAFRLFYQQGIHATGINQILSESGIAKKTLYHHFPTKDDLLLAVIAYRDQIFSQWLLTQLQECASVEALCDAWFMALDDWFNDRVDTLLGFRGCFFINSSGEYSEPDHPVLLACRAHKNSLQHALKKLLQGLMDEAAATVLSTQWCLLKEGAIVAATVSGNKNAARDARQMAQTRV
ncbi:MAG: TetR family transcriptional regulator [Oceanospirillaceae bacterium]|uniref:TetR/AcrR family transcriptional regulator n=1 Tax=unclassified Thalassolituus TaxID=2624967 RepID=UPI000C60CE1E|nr:MULTISPECIES: TetR/AcrR family transcriptional regulator [unclassified Thalassolituus]MAS26012.1 TetR family transcriptional regulator [Oceanospirillaceae bacterium]MAY00169.1 TetR family transcriptional regulator [Oceanospirillaceae bacterium]MBL33937.1 TetR family transcriptional regulator [Oceanospirillaceae bacterium]MBS52917.1 TetR family transcriptional regulator [Oceanospirillaceae bacterium]MBS54262.1 TetR family transcriptional regulator [Oceanospirillaceae bacterium]|tara:strand:- start:405 stop:1046 length:642 start_codon:yes stop_codon:yes gene_type:complete